MFNTLDVVLSGFPQDIYRFPNGGWRQFKLNGYNATYWHPYEKPSTMTINLVNIETFCQFIYPIVSIEINKKPISLLKQWWYENWRDDKIYDTSIKVLSYKIGTQLNMRSGKIFYVDEDTECIKNALDACVWNADIKESIV